MQDKLPFNRGFILVEALIALLIIVSVFSGALLLLSTSLSVNRIISDQYIGAQLAAEGVEIVKNIIDANVLRCLPWNAGFSSGTYGADYNDATLSPALAAEKLRFDSSTRRYSYDSGIPTRFNREIIINLVSADEIRVISTVNWIGKVGLSFSASLEDHFYNWRIEPPNIPPGC